MSFQSSLEALIGTFIAFYLGCALIGRPDIPVKVVAEMRAKALTGTSASWGCPSIFAGRSACNSYDPRRYR